MDADDDFYSGTENYSDYADSDADDADYEFVEDDADDSDDLIFRRRQQNYSVLSEADICKLQEDDISRISTVLSISRNSSAILLRHYNWCVSRVHDEWFADEEKVRDAVGLLGKPVVDFPTDGQLECGICFETFLSDKLHAAACGHPFCESCWEGYITTAINDGPGCLTLRCPDPSCRAAVGQDMINLLAPDKDRQKYTSYFVRSYVEDNRKTKWCPAPGCDYAVNFVVGSGNYDVNCRCCYSFCWNCAEEAHRPVDCDTVSKWILKNSAESENMNWILANSKPCPKCKRPIEKNQGCMHITCTPPCKFEFCWLCLGAWTEHGEKTGGFYACNRYEAAKQDGIYDETEKRREMAKNSLERYTHYYERWATNQSSRQKALVDLEKMQTDDIEKLSDIQCQPESQLKFIIEAWLQIVECRRVLKWTYAYGFYIPDHEHGKRVFFEYLQGEAESGLERLHQCAEKELQLYLDAKGPCEDFNEFRTKLAGLTSVTKNYFENLVRALENGLSDVSSQGVYDRTSSSKSLGGENKGSTSKASSSDSSQWSCEYCTYGDGSWHGGYLALAELSRRGLLLPRSFPQVVPVIVKALHYDVRRGPHSVGSHVRDATAYVCWAFGRAYYHKDMKNVLDQLAPDLLIVGSFDREVNCRRAAAAAFQENVGRQGNYPHGIDIVNIANYFSLSSRVNSCLEVAVSIAQYEGYLYPFVDELLYNKICHWDKSLRELAAETLAALVKYEPKHFANYVLEKLTPRTLSTDLCMRHGATLAAGEVVLALHQCGYVLSADSHKLMAGVVPAIEKARLYRGKGGEIMRLAVSRFIECISLSHVTLSERTERILLDTLNENLRHPNSEIQNAAVNAVKQLVQSYLVFNDKIAVDLVSKHLTHLTDPNVAARRGFALALGVLPCELLTAKWKDVVLKLCSACQIEANPEDRDAEARMNAVKGLTSVCETLTQKSASDPENDDLSLFVLIKTEVVDTLLKALDDYSVDNRGDVGSWVREAAIHGLEKCTYILCKKVGTNSAGDHNNDSSSLFDSNLATHLIGGFVKQGMEKMDKVREAAAKVLQRILYHKTVTIPFIPYRETLEEIIPNKASLQWAVPGFSFPRFVQLLKFRCYSKQVMSGLVISIGGLQESLKTASLSALLEYVREEGEAKDLKQQQSRESAICDDILWILQEYKKCDRVIVPCLKTIQELLDRIFRNQEAYTLSFYIRVMDSLAIELRASKKFEKVEAGIGILGSIASVSEPISTQAFSQLLPFLAHQYPKIRNKVAFQAYLALLQNKILVPEDKIEKVKDILSQTCWDANMESTHSQRLELCELTCLDHGVVLRTRNRRVTKDMMTALDENASYSALVDSSGF